MCAKGIPDYLKCSCVEFPGDDELKEIIDQLKNITESLGGQTNENITNAINETQKDIDDLNNYIQENQNNLNLTYISDTIIYIRIQVNSLTIIVKAFKSTLEANTNCPNSCVNNYSLRESDCSCMCSINCNENQIYNWRYCQCVDYSEAAVLYSLDTEIEHMFIEVSYNTVNTTVVQDFLTRIYTLEDRLYDYIATLEYYVTEYNMTVQTQIIHHYKELITSITTEYYTWVVSTRPCTKACDLSYQLLIKDCSCFSSDEVDRYYSLLDIFVIVEYNIQRYGGFGSPTQLATFVVKAEDIRQLFQELYERFFNIHYVNTLDQILNLLDEIDTLTTTLDNDFENWKSINTPSTVCSISCSPTEIANLKICECVNIIDWDKLIDVQIGLDKLDIDINNLQIDAGKKKTLLDNL